MLRPDRRIERVYLHRAPVDMRRQIDGLSLLAKDVMQMDPMSGAMCYRPPRSACPEVRCQSWRCVAPTHQRDDCDARRLPVGNLLVRATGVVLALAFVGPIAGMLAQYDTDPGRRVVDFHVVFNICLALGFLLSVESFSKLLTKMLPDPPTATNAATPLYLDQAGLSSGTVALANASRETLRMADMVEQMLQRLPDVLFNGNRAGAAPITADGRTVDLLGDSIRLFLADIGDEQDVDTQSGGTRAQDVFSAVINFEHIADIICNGIMEYAIRSLKAGQRLDEEERELISSMHTELMQTMTLAVRIFLQPEPIDARRLVESKGSFRVYEARAATLSVRRLRGIAESAKAGAGESAERLAEESGLLLRLARDLRRIQSHLARFAYPLLDRPKTSRRTSRSASAAKISPKD